MLPIIKRDRRPFISAAQRARTRAHAKTLLAMHATAEGEEKAALAAAVKALGGQLPKPTAELHAAPAVIGGNPETNKAGGSAPAGGQNITPAMQKLMEDRPDLADKLTEIAKQALPAQVKIPQMKKLIADTPLT